MNVGGGWIIELDIQNYFEEICHRQLLEMVDKRVGDGALKRLLGKWLGAGVLENSSRQPSATPWAMLLAARLALAAREQILVRAFADPVAEHRSGVARNDDTVAAGVLALLDA